VVITGSSASQQRGLRGIVTPFPATNVAKPVGLHYEKEFVLKTAMLFAALQFTLGKYLTTNENHAE
jgi:hypothetical protein